MSRICIRRLSIFSAKSYEYTAKYRAFVKEMKAKEKRKRNVIDYAALMEHLPVILVVTAVSCTSDRSAVSADYNAPEIRKGA